MKLAGRRWIQVLSLWLLAACANTYDFDRARLPDGSWDFAKLLADYKAGGEQKLFSLSWTPLLHLNSIGFERAEENFGALYMLNDIDSEGPLLCMGNVHRFVVDDRGNLIERRRIYWEFWAIPTYKRHVRIETAIGLRRETFDRVWFTGVRRLIWYPEAAKSR